MRRVVDWEREGWCLSVVREGLYKSSYTNKCRQCVECPTILINSYQIMTATAMATITWLSEGHGVMEFEQEVDETTGMLQPTWCWNSCSSDHRHSDILSGMQLQGSSDQRPSNW